MSRTIECKTQAEFDKARTALMSRTFVFLAALLSLSFAATPALARDHTNAGVTTIPASNPQEAIRNADTPCASGNLTHEIRCILHDVHGGVPGGFHAVDHIINCESGWNEKAGSAHSLYAGLFQLERIEQESWPIPGASHWMREYLHDNPNVRSAKGRLDGYATGIIALSHAAGPEGWDWIGACY